MNKTSALLLTAVIAMVGALSLARFWPGLAAAQSATEDSMKEKVVAAEKAGLDALKAGDVARFGELTADDALFVDAHGPAGKAQVLNNVSGFRLTDYSMGEVTFKRLAADSGLITYKISETGNSHGKDFTAQVYVTSIWVQRAGKWLCLFSQESAPRQ